MINPDFLRTFLELSRTRHFTRTAALLNMTQPGVSQHVKKLEEYLGTALFKLDGRELHLTEAGRKTAAYAAALYKDHEAFLGSLQEDAPDRGVCRLSTPGSLGLPLYDTLLELGEKHPALDIHLTVAPNTEVERKLIEESIDMGYMTQPPTHPLIKAEKVGEEKLRIAWPPQRALPKRFRDFQEAGFISHPDGVAQATRVFQKNFPSEFHSMKQIPVRGSINQINRILDPVAAGLGFTVLPDFARQKYGARLKIKWVSLPKEIKDSLYLVHRGHESLPARYRSIHAFFAKKL